VAIDSRTKTEPADHESFRVLVNFSGTIVLAAPYAVAEHYGKLSASLGPQVADKLRREAASENFYAILVRDGGKIETYRWVKPSIAFNGVHVVKCGSGELLKLDIQNAFLSDVKVVQQ